MDGRPGKEPVLRALFGRAPTDPQPTPVYAGVRLRNSGEPILNVSSPARRAWLSSTRQFQPPHAAHCPAHLAWTAPHD